MDKVWYLPPPTDEVVGDFGPYPVKQLKAARGVLIKSIQDNKSTISRKIKFKCGIMMDGRRMISGIDVGSVPVDMEGAISATDLSDSSSEFDRSRGEKPGTKRRADSEAGTSQPKKHAPEKFVAYVCDLCKYFTVSCNDMTEHLQENEHFAASMCCCFKENGILKPKTIIRPLAVVNSAARFKSIIPTCPKCYTVYENINMCNYHCRSTHPDCSDVYALAKVQETTVSLISKDHQCMECNRVFTKPKSLHDHWKSADHFPIREPTKSEIRVMFCSICAKTFYDFYSCKEHLRISHSGESENGLFTIEVLYLEKPDTELHILPYSSTNALNTMNKETANKIESKKPIKRRIKSKILSENIKLYKMFTQQS